MKLNNSIESKIVSRSDLIRDYYDNNIKGFNKFRKRNSYYVNEVTKLAKELVGEPKSMLDVGCGLGYFLAELSPQRGVGIDFAPTVIEEAKRLFPRSNLEFKVADVQKDKIEEKFDCITFINCLCDIEDVWAAFRTARSCATQDTRLVIINYNYLWAPILKLGEKIGMRMPQSNLNWFSFEDVSNLLYLNGFELVNKGYSCLFPIKIPIISNLINRFIAPLPFIHRLGLATYFVARPLPGGLRPSRPCTVSVICPVRNEVGNIEECCRRLPKMGTHTELIFVDGNSTDGTREKILEMIEKYSGSLEIQLVDQGEGKGKGDAMRKGYAAARNDIFMILDGDLTVPPEDLPKFYAAIEEGRGEFINGSRLVYSMEEDAMMPLNLAGNKFFAFVFSFLLGQKLKDTLCGTKVLRRHHYEMIEKNRSWFGDFDPFGDFDLLFGAARLNLRIVEIPIRYRARAYGETKISRFSHGLLLFKMCWIALKRLKFRLHA